MEDLKIKTTRTHEIVEGQLIVKRIQEGEREPGKFVRVITEETGINLKDCEEVLNEHVPKKLEEFHKQISQTEEIIKELEEKTKDYENNEEFNKFKDFIDSEQAKEFFNMLKDLEELKSKDKLLDHYNEEIKEVISWKEQFENIKKDLEQ